MCEAPKFHVGQAVKAIINGFCGDTYEVSGRVEACKRVEPQEQPPTSYLEPEPYRYRISGDEGLYRESILEAIG